jgi:hypothetical protein
MRIKDIARCFNKINPTHNNNEYLISKVHRISSNNIKSDSNITSPKKPNQRNKKYSNLLISKSLTKNFSKFS